MGVGIIILLVVVVGFTGQAYLRSDSPVSKMKSMIPCK